MRFGESLCPINEQTADGTRVGRCCFHLPDGVTCPRHGDVGPEVRQYVETVNLKLENDMLKRRDSVKGVMA